MPDGPYIQTIEGTVYGALSSVERFINCQDCDILILRFHNTTGGAWNVEVRDHDTVNSPGGAIATLTVAGGVDGVIVMNRFSQFAGIVGTDPTPYLPGIVGVDINAAAATTWSFTKIKL